MGEVLRPQPTSWRRLLDVTLLGTIDSLIDTYDRRCAGPYGTHLRALRRSPATIDRYWLAAHQLEEFLLAAGWDSEVGGITRPMVEKFIADSLESAAPSTVNGRFVALQQFFKYVAVCAGALDEPYRSPMEGMTAPAFEPPVIEIIPERVIAGMLVQVEGGRERRTFEEIRDAAVIRLFMDTGARNAEITNLRLEDLLDGDKVRLTGKSKGKGPVERHHPYGPRTAAALRRYLRTRQHHPQAGSERLWLGIKGPMTTSGVRQMIWKRSARAGLRVHPHQFRHTNAHHAKKQQRSAEDIKYLLGWRTDAMLERYGASLRAERAIETYRELGSPLGDL